MRVARARARRCGNRLRSLRRSARRRRASPPGPPWTRTNSASRRCHTGLERLSASASGPARPPPPPRATSWISPGREVDLRVRASGQRQLRSRRARGHVIAPYALEHDLIEPPLASTAGPRHRRAAVAARAERPPRTRRPHRRTGRPLPRAAGGPPASAARAAWRASSSAAPVDHPEIHTWLIRRRRGRDRRRRSLSAAGASPYDARGTSPRRPRDARTRR